MKYAQKVASVTTTLPGQVWPMAARRLGGEEATYKEVIDFTSPSLYRKLQIKNPSLRL